MRKKMWRCKSCGRVCDGSNTVCPDCGLDLGFYGEIQFVETGDPEPSPSSGSQPQKQPEPVAKEESRPEIKEKRVAKERRPEKKSKHGKVIIGVGVVSVILTVLLAVLLVCDYVMLADVYGIRVNNFTIDTTISRIKYFIRGFVNYRTINFWPVFTRMFLLEVAICIGLAVVLVLAAKRSKAKTEGKPGIVLISAGVVMLALLVLERIMRIMWIRHMLNVNWATKYFYSSACILFELLVYICLVVVLIITMVREAKRS